MPGMDPWQFRFIVPRARGSGIQPMASALLIYSTQLPQRPAGPGDSGTNCVSESALGTSKSLTVRDLGVAQSRRASSQDRSITSPLEGSREGLLSWDSREGCVDNRVRTLKREVLLPARWRVEEASQCFS